MPIDERTPLRKAVDKLIAEGKLKQDKDLQGIFNLSKSTISAYLNNPRPGKRFINEFEKKFGISLNSFSTVNEILQSSEPPNHDAYIESLKTQIKLLEKIDDIEKKLKIFETNLAEVLSNQAGFDRFVDGCSNTCCSL